MTMKAHTYYIIFGRPPIGGELPPFLPSGGATDLAPFLFLYICHCFLLLPALCIELKALCFRVVRPSVRACVRTRAETFSDRLAGDF